MIKIGSNNIPAIVPPCSNGKKYISIDRVQKFRTIKLNASATGTSPMLINTAMPLNGPDTSPLSKSISRSIKSKSNNPIIATSQYNCINSNKAVGIIFTPVKANLKSSVTIPSIPTR